MKSTLPSLIMVGLISAIPLLAFSQSISPDAPNEETIVEPITSQAVSPVPGETAITPTVMMKVPGAKLRTPAQMDEVTRMAAPVGSALPPFLPTTGIAEYLAAKAVAASRAPAEARPNATDAAAPLAPPIAAFQFEGVNQTTAGGSFPPDTHGAAGLTHFVEVTNQHVDVYVKATGLLVKSVSLASFFGFSLAPSFDPRVVYDRTWNRWIIIADSFPISSTDQRQLIAISRTSDPLGAFFIYTGINVMPAIGTGRFWDFPHLGMDQDSIIVTANVFLGNSFQGARMFAVAKARLYNGLGFSVPVFSFSSAVGTVAPPIVLDQSAKTFLVAAPSSGSALKLFTLRDSSNANQATLTGPVNVPVAAYALPPNAPQCFIASAAELLDTLDARFVNASTQTGNFLWNVHSVNFGGAAVRWYKINTATNALVQSKTHFQSVTSSDFNASIAANDAGDIYLTSTSASSTVCPQVVFNGERSGLFPPTAGSVLFTSPTKITGNFDPNFGTQRWGDYSAVTLDPAAVGNAWLVNEKVNSTSVWGSRIGRIRF